MSIRRLPMNRAIIVERPSADPSLLSLSTSRSRPTARARWPAASTTVIHGLQVMIGARSTSKTVAKFGCTRDLDYQTGLADTAGSRAFTAIPAPTVPAPQLKIICARRP